MHEPPDPLPDPLLDAKLRDVPLPEDLLARLRTASVPDDDELDEAIRDVPVSSDFTQRLQARLDESILDDALRDVPVPGDLLARLHVIPESRAPAGWRRLALAACLMLVVGGLYGLTLGAVLNAVRPRAAAASPLAEIDLGPLELELRQVHAPVVQVPRERPLPVPYTPARLEPEGIQVELIAFDRRVMPGAAGQLAALQATDFRPDDDVFRLRWGALGAPHFGDSPPFDLEQVPAPRAPGHDLPIVRGYDRVFWKKHGIHPPISPARHPRLAQSGLSLSTRTDSLELTRRRLAAWRLPDAAHIRVEDFLAAIDYQFARPQRGAVAIRTAAGPAPFARQPHQLLQIGLQAGRAPRSPRGTHLTVALDLSTSMGAGDRLEMAKRALNRLANFAGTDDRISLIAFHHDVFPLVEALPPEQLAELPAITASLRAAGGDNLAGGLQEAVSILLGSGLDDQYARSLIVLTDGQNNLPARARALTGSLLEIAAEHDVQTTFVQIGEGADEPPFVADLRGRGSSWVQAATSQDVLWGLVEGLTGASVAVAENPFLGVEFNPQAVRAYRLIGHGTLATSDLPSLSETTTLHNDESATALYEVWLYPNEVEEVAWVRAQWQDPRTGHRHRSPRHTVSRSQFATSVGEMPLSLQAAAVAAEIGKILSESYDFELSGAASFQHQKKSPDFRQLIAACRKLNPSLESWADFQELMGLLTTLDRVRRNQTSSGNTP